MLICNVSLRPLRRVVVSEIAEAATAVDALGTGNIVFATLVDDPASVQETVDAYLGEIMLEAASASDTLTAGSAFIAAIDEAVTAVDSVQGVTGVLPTRSAMVAGPVFVNPTSRDANADGIMVNAR
jgi:hypothetical protein